MGTENTSNISRDYIYLVTENGDFITAEDGRLIIVGKAPFPKGNNLETIEMIVNMGEGRRILPVNKTGWDERPPPARDRRGRKINWNT
jgi:hypothetical protein